MKSQRTFRWVLAPLILFLSFSTYEVKSYAQSLDVKDWVIEFRGDKSPGTSEIALNSFYVLKNITLGKYVGYGRREYGVNLIWDAPLPIDDGNIRFESSGGSGPLRLGQPIAVYVKDGGYLYYKEREYGINLEYSKTTPIYQWEFQGTESSGPVKLRTNIALYNSRSRDYVVYCRRDYGINLRWAKDCKPQYHRP
jgi:hypothetical protein